MRFSVRTTTLDLINEYTDGVFDLLHTIESKYDQWSKNGLDERLIAAKTRKLILKYFFDNGGL